MGGDKKDKEKEKKQLVPGWPMPEMDETSMEQEILVTELLNKVVKNPPEDKPPPQYLLDLSEVDLRILSYKYLTARKWKMEDAEKMWYECITFRAVNKCYEIGHFPPAYAVRGYDFAALNDSLGLPERTPDELERIQRSINPAYEGVYHKWDKLGHPVFIERSGRIRVRHLLSAFKGLAAIKETPDDVCVRYHIHVNEIGARFVKYNDMTIGKEIGRRVLGVVVIVDCTGLGYHTLYNPALQMLKKNSACDAAYYPEGMHKIFVVNTPTMINFAWSIVKGWLDPRVRSKILFVKPDKTPETLLEIIDADNLPEFLGGNCTCEEQGGCIETMELAEASPANAPGEGVMTEEINIKAGKNETREYSMEVGEEVAWEWEVMDMNVEFSVKYFPHDGSDPEEVVPSEKGNEGAGSYTADKASGRLVLVWSNHYSWMKSKTLRLRCLKMVVDVNAPKKAPAEVPEGEGTGHTSSGNVTDESSEVKDASS